MGEDITLMTLLRRAVKRVPVQAIFARDPYESRREALPGSKLLWGVMVYSLIKSRFWRGLVRAIEDHLCKRPWAGRWHATRCRTPWPSTRSS